MPVHDLSTYTYNPAMGLITIEANHEMLFRLTFNPVACCEEKSNQIIRDTVSQLDEYFSGKRELFDLPMCLAWGTVFQRQVWEAISSIPYGETRTYKQLAEMIGSRNAFRAVGNACGQNRYPLLIPCHRVVGSSSIGGFSADLCIKEKLLEFEAKTLAGVL